MKKFWIGAGISIIVIIIANITAQKLVPERALPISVFSACLCLFIPLAISFVMLLIADIKNLKENKPNGNKRKGNNKAFKKEKFKETLALSFLIVAFGLGLTIITIRGANAMKDLVNGPTEQAIHRVYLKERKKRNHYTKSNKRQQYLICRTYDKNNTPMEIKVDKSKVDYIKDVMSDGFDVYGMDDKYVVYYFKNLNKFVDIQVLDPENQLQ